MKDILKALKTSIVGLVGSRKFMVAVISAIVWVVGKWGVELNAEELIPVVAPLWGYIAAMIGADWGKSGKEIEATKPTPPDAG